MIKRVLEESVLFISVIKWFLLASFTGLIVGVSTTAFLKGLQYSSVYTGGYRFYFLLLPVAMFLSSLMIKYIAPEAEGHGTEKIIEAVHVRAGKVDPLVVPIKLVATIVTIALGGSAGKEGPCAQIGAGLSSTFARILKFDARDRKKLVICGISAGFATVFGTPIAGAIFGVEVLFVGTILYDVLFPSFVAGLIGYQVSSTLGVSYFYEKINLVPEFTGIFFLEVCIAGVFFGLCSFLLIEMMKWFETLAEETKVWKPLKGLIGGGALAVLSLIIGGRYLGLGLDTIEVALKGGPVPLPAFLLKMLYTSVTLSFGGSGGIVTPIFFVGATSGSVFAKVMGLNPQIFAAIGMVSLVAGAANTPISASIMAVELFGPNITPYAAVACVISFLMTGHRSVYPSQVLAVTKSPSIIIESGKTMEAIRKVEIKPRERSVTGTILWGVDNLSRRFKKKKSEDEDGPA
jgi:H+/Cl- antiporter ClcA